MTTASGEHAHERKASELFVEALENEGVEYVFAVPAIESPAIIEPAPQSELKVEGAAAAGAANASNASDASDAAKTDTSK